MKKDFYLKVILYISIAGILFSGYLSYTEIFAHFCGASSLGLGACSAVFQIPACVYGLCMYIIIFVLSLIGLRSKK